MKPSIQQCLRRRSLLLLLAGVLFVPFVEAGELSPSTARQVQKALTLQSQEQWQEAAEVLENADAPTDFDKAFVNRILGVVYWQKEEPIKAINALYAAVNSKVLEEKEQLSSERMLADLLMIQSRYRDALTFYYPLARQEQVPARDKAEIWLRIAQAHYQNRQYSDALKGIDQHLKRAAATVSSLSLKLGAQVQLKHWKGSTRTLKQLIALEPKNKAWWVQLVGSYQRLKDNRQMLNTLILASRDGISLTASEKIMMAQLYQQQGVPEKAAALMQEVNRADDKPDVTRVVMEASYWQQAKEWEKAIGAWEQAAHLSPKYYWAASQLSLQHGYYQKALTLLENVQQPEKAADIELARTFAYDKLDQIDQALMHAKRAHELTPSSQSESWIQYLSQKRQTLKILPVL